MCEYCELKPFYDDEDIEEYRGANFSMSEDYDTICLRKNIEYLDDGDDETYFDIFIFLPDYNMEDGIETDAIKFCPFCGRKLK